jgi:uncharacterized protein YciI
MQNETQMAQRVVVRVSAGPAWRSGSVREQRDWGGHAEFVDRLVDEGKFILGGPFSDNSGSMSVYEGMSADEVRALMEEDPFVKNGVFVVEDVREWTVFVDRLSPSS